jgi:hypothetical protein
MLYPLVPETEEFVPEAAALPEVHGVSQLIHVPDAEEWEDETYCDDDVAEFQHQDVYFD